ncbi:DUF3253 domain-containing protein [Rhodophyticola sp.]|jgi:hypothetical protein|uniref:DUF3253 domain-containing protein n=1 Tax=Rhodophyticola sp. TaxID=2680032 RepID=UPI003D29FF80
MDKRRSTIDDHQIDETMMRLAAKRGPEKTICPSEVAREIAGSDPEAWRRLMGPIRDRAVAAAKTGRIAIKQGGQPVDPDDFSGIYRIAIQPN